MAPLPDLPGRERGVRSRDRGARSLARTLDRALLVGVSIVAVLIVLKIVGIIAGTIFFVLKLVVLAAVLYGVLRFFARRR